MILLAYQIRSGAGFESRSFCLSCFVICCGYFLLHNFLDDLNFDHDIKDGLY